MEELERIAKENVRQFLVVFRDTFQKQVKKLANKK